MENQRKKRVLFCGEAHTTKSGFGRYTYEVMSRLYNTQKYELAEFASYMKDDAIIDVPWKVYPNVPADGNQEEINIYNSNSLNQFGQWRFEKVILDFKPDIVFDIRDYWMFSYQEVSPLRDYFTWIIGPTIDSIPQKPEWLKTFENADVVLTHTDWAADYLRSLNRPINIGPCISDSVDTNQFRPIGWTKNYHKTKYNIPTDSIIIGSVMRNQKRKLIAELFCSLRKLLDLTQNNKIFLYLHTSYPESNGWNIPELLQEYDVYNNVLFTYYNPISRIFFPSLYKGPKIPCVYKSTEFAIFPNVIHGLDNNQLCDVYNLFDIYVQYAICEGLGIPQLEAAACGVPVCAINYSGMEELTTKLQGIKIDHILTKELETGSDRANPKNEDLVQKLSEWIDLEPEKKLELSKKTRQLLTDQYSWDKTTQTICDVFDSIKPKNLWDKPLEINPSIPVPLIENNRHFINYIICNLLKEPNLLQSYFIQSMIRSLDESVMLNNNRVEPAQRQNFIKILENYLNNKGFCEEVRSGKMIMNDTFLKK